MNKVTEPPIVVQEAIVALCDAVDENNMEKVLRHLILITVDEDGAASHIRTIIDSGKQWDKLPGVEELGGEVRDNCAGADGTAWGMCVMTPSINTLVAETVRKTAIELGVPPALLSVPLACTSVKSELVRQLVAATLPMCTDEYEKHAGQFSHILLGSYLPVKLELGTEVINTNPWIVFVWGMSGPQVISCLTGLLQGGKE